jgi:uncharacterized protein YkwD
MKMAKVSLIWNLMTTKITLSLFLLLMLASCVTPSTEPAGTEAPVVFVTSTLPPTKPGLTVPTPVPPTATATLDPSAPTPTPSCRDAALFVEDVTYPDNARLDAGEPFTKTWKFKNNGNCQWTGYTIAFVSGDRMGAPESVEVPETEPQSEVAVSVELLAPSEDGAYTGIFELRNEKGDVVPLGFESTFWVKILVGVEGIIGNCTYTENPEFVEILIELINQARADVGRPALAVNEQLTEAARKHSLDMACNNFLEHSGSDGTWTGDRVRSAGYTKPYYLEILAIGLPQDAMNQWEIERNDWSAVLNSRVTEIGVGYVFSKFSAYGGYWTVVMGGE